MATTRFKTAMRLVVASHNIMDGHFIGRLRENYRAMQRSRSPLNVLCIQEAVPRAAEAIAAVLGRRFAVAAHASAPRLAFVYDRARLRLRGLQLLRLPKLARVPFLQRFYCGSSAEQKHAVFGRFAWRHRGARRRAPSRRGVTLVNFHLDTAGYNAHRVLQTRAVSAAHSCTPRRRRWPLVACGDTNAFDFRAAEAERDLAQIVEPLRRDHRAADAHAAAPAPTHFFARAAEPKLAQRLAVLFGRLGIDFPRRYDVVAAAPRCAASGVVRMAGSDHDLVWAALAPFSRRWLG